MTAQDREQLRENEIEEARRLFNDPASRIEGWAFQAFILHKRGGDLSMFCSASLTSSEIRQAVRRIQDEVTRRIQEQERRACDGKQK